MSVLLFLSQIYICFIIIRRKSLLIETMQERVWKVVIFSGGLLSVYTGIDKGESIYGLLRLGVYLIAGVAFQQIRDKRQAAHLVIYTCAGSHFICVQSLS